jgi:hypothetical protein
MFQSKWDKKNNTYDGIKVTWNNIEELQIKFLETQYRFREYELELYEYEKMKESFDINYKIKKEMELSQWFDDLKQELQEAYKVVFAVRKTIENLYENSNEIKNEIDRRCENDIAFFISSFIWTRDPRLSSLGIPSKLPFVLTPFQKWLVEEIENNYKRRQSKLIEKSRAE